MKKVSVVARVEFDEDRMCTLLCSALEGGSNYWYKITKFVEPPKLEYRTDESQVFRHLDYPMNEGGAIFIKDLFGDYPQPYTLDRKRMVKGLQVMADKFPRHFRNFMEENDDAETGDVFLQCCIFGDVVFG